MVHVSETCIIKWKKIYPLLRIEPRVSPMKVSLLCKLVRQRAHSSALEYLYDSMNKNFFIDRNVLEKGLQLLAVNDFFINCGGR